MAEVWAILKVLATAMGFLRLVCKPIMDIIQKAVEQTETPVDDLFLEKILGSKIYQAVKWFIDYFGSIKIDQTEKLLRKK